MSAEVPILSTGTAWRIPGPDRDYVITGLSTTEGWDRCEVSFIAVDSELGQDWLRKRAALGLPLPASAILNDQERS